MAKKRVFVSFDFDNDKNLRDLLIGQAKNPDSPFEVTDHSLKETAPEKSWKQKAWRAIERSDVVVFMLGRRTRFAPGVKKEAEMAIALRKERFQIIGYQDGSRDWAVAGGGRVYKWTWENLRRLLS